MRAHHQFTSKYSSKIGDERKETEGNDYEKSLLTKLFEQIWRTWLDLIWFCLHRATFDRNEREIKVSYGFFCIRQWCAQQSERKTGLLGVVDQTTGESDTFHHRVNSNDHGDASQKQWQRHADVFRWKSLIIHIMHSVHYRDNCSIFGACIIYTSHTTTTYSAFVCFMFFFDHLLFLLSQPQIKSRMKSMKSSWRQKRCFGAAYIPIHNKLLLFSLPSFAPAVAARWNRKYVIRRTKE